MVTPSPSDESAPLMAGEKLLQDHDVKVKPLRYRDIPRAVDGASRAFANSSMQRYFKDAENPTLHRVRQRIDTVVRFTDAVSRARLNAIDCGDSFLLYGVPGDNKEKPPFSWVVSFMNLLGNRELRKRKNEYGTKAKALIDTAFGEETEELFEIQRLGTVPEKQGRGYATALISFVHDMADAQGRATFVLTGDTWKFYESVGYKLVGEDWFGDDNPKYHGPPGPIRLMVREPQPIVKA